MTTKIETLAGRVRQALGERALEVVVDRDEATVVVRPGGLVALMTELRDRPELRFEMLVDACGVDYSTYANQPSGLTCIDAGKLASSTRPSGRPVAASNFHR